MINLRIIPRFSVTSGRLLHVLMEGGKKRKDMKNELNKELARRPNQQDGGVHSGRTPKRDVLPVSWRNIYKGGE